MMTGVVRGGQRLAIAETQGLFRLSVKQLETQLSKSADDLRANSDLAASEYATPVLRLIFLEFADGKFKEHLPAIKAEYKKLKGSRSIAGTEDRVTAIPASTMAGIADRSGYSSFFAVVARMPASSLVFLARSFNSFTDPLHFPKAESCDLITSL